MLSVSSLGENCRHRGMTRTTTADNLGASCEQGRKRFDPGVFVNCHWNGFWVAGQLPETAAAAAIGKLPISAGKEAERVIGRGQGLWPGRHFSRSPSAAPPAPGQRSGRTICCIPARQAESRSGCLEINCLYPFLPPRSVHQSFFPQEGLTHFSPPLHPLPSFSFHLRFLGQASPPV